MSLSGGNVELNMSFEDSYGNPSTSGFKVGFAPTSSAFTDQAINESSVINGNPSPSQGFLGFKDGQVSLTVPVDTLAFPQVLKGLMGTPTTTDNGDGTYSHVFKRGTSIPSMSAEFNHTDAVGGLFYLTKGIGLNELSIDFGGDGELLATVTGIAQDTSKATSTQFTTVIDDLTTGDKFGQFQASITGTSAKFKSFNMAFNNNINADSYVIDGTGARNSNVPGKFSINGNFTVLFESDTLFNEARNFTTQRLTNTLTNGLTGADLRSIEFDIEEANFNARTNGEIASPNGLEASFDYQGFFKDGTNGSALQVTVINDVASYA